MCVGEVLSYDSLPWMFNAMWGCQCVVFSWGVLEVACFDYIKLQVTLKIHVSKKKNLFKKRCEVSSFLGWDLVSETRYTDPTIFRSIWDKKKSWIFLVLLFLPAWPTQYSYHFFDLLCIHPEVWMDLRYLPYKYSITLWNKKSSSNSSLNLNKFPVIYK
jgi:hypothetical protein